ncbi:MAG: TfoX/Sxy family protein [Jatrophihabitans sp.]|uniref:TfoX/Sxy family protein n=1 Tax=Jatrophihabitans sp. TaxID=1932789 RepID=UPI003F80ED7C
MAYDEELAERLRALVAREAGLHERRMFGGLAFLLRGHLAVSVSGRGGLLLRCDPARTDELVAAPVASRFEMRGRPMGGWLRVEVSGLDDAALAEWVAIGVTHARSLPPK